MLEVLKNLEKIHYANDEDKTYYFHRSKDGNIHLGKFNDPKFRVIVFDFNKGMIHQGQNTFFTEHKTLEDLMSDEGEMFYLALQGLNLPGEV